MFSLVESEVDPSTLYVGEQITCENGHWICTVKETFYRGDFTWSKKLGDWQIPEPDIGSLPTCHCGAYFWSGMLHVKNRGWVSRYGMIKMPDGTIRTCNVPTERTA